MSTATVYPSQINIHSIIAAHLSATTEQYVNRDTKGLIKQRLEHVKKIYKDMSQQVEDTKDPKYCPCGLHEYRRHRLAAECRVRFYEGHLLNGTTRSELVLSHMYVNNQWITVI